MLASAVQQSVSAICIYIYVPPLLDLPPTPTLPTHLGYHRTLSWAPCAIQQVPTRYLFYRWSGSVVKKLLATVRDAGDAGSIPGSGRSPGEGNGNPPPYSCLETPMDTRAQRATVQGVTKNWTWLSTQCIYVHPNLSVHPALHICPVSSHPFSMSTYSCPADRCIYTIFLDSTYIH